MTWYVIRLDEGVKFSADTKKECVRWCGLETGDPDPTTRRYSEGSYEYNYSTEHSIRVTTYHIIREDRLKATGFDWINK